LRESKLQEQKRQQEERVRRALARSQETKQRAPGRKLMYRSQPPPKAKPAAARKARHSAEDEEMRYFFT